MKIPKLALWHTNPMPVKTRWVIRFRIMQARRKPVILGGRVRRISYRMHPYLKLITITQIKINPIRCGSMWGDLHLISRLLEGLRRLQEFLRMISTGKTIMHLWHLWGVLTTYLAIKAKCLIKINLGFCQLTNRGNHNNKIKTCKMLDPIFCLLTTGPKYNLQMELKS